jgi:putative transposase
VIQCDAGLLPRIDALKAEHPFWGDRRTWAYLRFVEHLAVSNQRILRLLREQHLLVPPNLRPRAKWTPTGSKPRPTKPQAWWGLDLTKVRGTGFSWISIVVVLDGYSKQLVSCDAGVPCTAKHGVAALDMAVNQQFPDGAQGKGWSLMSDHGCHPTLIVFMEAYSIMEIHQAFTSANTPKGYADTERCLRPLQEECRWWQAWPPQADEQLRTLGSARQRALAACVPGVQNPNQCERDSYRSHSPPCRAA